MENTRPLTDRIVARAVSEARRLAIGSGSRRLSLTTRLVVARMEPFARRVAPWIVRRTGSTAFLDDVLQDALLIVAMRLAHLEQASVKGLRAFTCGVLRHRGLGIAVRERRLRVGGTQRAAEEACSAEAGPVEHAIQCDLMKTIRRAANGLRRSHHRVTVMLLRGTDSRVEIARRLQISLDVAAMRKSRALQALRKSARALASPPGEPQAREPGRVSIPQPIARRGRPIHCTRRDGDRLVGRVELRGVHFEPPAGHVPPVYEIMLERVPARGQ